MQNDVCNVTTWKLMRERGFFKVKKPDMQQIVQVQYVNPWAFMCSFNQVQSKTSKGHFKLTLQEHQRVQMKSTDFSIKKSCTEELTMKQLNKQTN